MAKDKCPVCKGEPGDGYHKDPEEICGTCGGSGEEGVAKKASKKKGK